MSENRLAKKGSLDKIWQLLTGQMKSSGRTLTYTEYDKYPLTCLPSFHSIRNHTVSRLAKFCKPREPSLCIFFRAWVKFLTEHTVFCVNSFYWPKFVFFLGKSSGICMAIVVDYIWLYFVTNAVFSQIWYCQKYALLGVKTCFPKKFCVRNMKFSMSVWVWVTLCYASDLVEFLWHMFFLCSWTIYVMFLISPSWVGYNIEKN